MPQDILIIRSDRKTLSIEVKPDLQVVIRVPLKTKNSQIQAFLREKAHWLEQAKQRVKQRQQQREVLPPISHEQVKALARQATALFPEWVAFFARQMGVSYGRITVRNQVSRWGSCSGKGNLNFNCLLMLCPREVRDYVIIHELAHLRHMDHSAAFWKLVEEHCPRYVLHRKWLKEQGVLLIRRMQDGEEN